MNVNVGGAVCSIRNCGKAANVSKRGRLYCLDHLPGPQSAMEFIEAGIPAADVFAALIGSPADFIERESRQRSSADLASENGQNCDDTSSKH